MVKDGRDQQSSSLFASEVRLDPGLSSLFAPSTIPQPKSSVQRRHQKERVEPAPLPSQTSSPDDASEPKKSLGSEADHTSHYGAGQPQFERVHTDLEAQTVPQPGRRKKRKREDEDIEALYLQRLEREEGKERARAYGERKAKRSEQDTSDNEKTRSTTDVTSPASPDLDSEGKDGGISPPPLHETLAPTKVESELDKAARTIFLANVSVSAITSKSSKKVLLCHLSSIFKSLPQSKTPHKIESMRFRSTAFTGNVSKKAAFAQKDLMEATTKSTNAYVVYTTRIAAREAARKLNGTVVLGRHLRVDEIAHPAKIDSRRCVFVGNLGFVDDESQIKAAQKAETGNKQSKAKSGDNEEGLWQQFGNAGTVESVRVVRDSKTRVGKGFAYVQFTDQNAVEAALLYNDKSFPPLLPRKLRVVRAKKPKRNQSEIPAAQGPNRIKAVKKGSLDPDVKSLQGRVGKLLGRSGAAELRPSRRGPRNPQSANGNGTDIPTPQSFIFEGHRASSKQGNRELKLRQPSRKRSGKPQNRGTKRAAAWRAKGGTTKGK